MKAEKKGENFSVFNLTNETENSFQHINKMPNTCTRKKEHKKKRKFLLVCLCDAWRTSRQIHSYKCMLVCV